MRGRWPGAGLLVLAMIAVIAGHGLFRGAIAGSPVSLALSATPRVGDCVLYLPDPAGDTTGDSRYRNVAFGPCRGVLVGEIASVQTGPGLLADRSMGALMGTAGACWASASRYVGLSATGRVTMEPADLHEGIDWSLELRVRGQAVGADVLQRAAGRDWTACVVRPENLDVYLGSVRGALVGGTAPAAYGNCSSSASSILESSVDCSNPHPVERLGWAAIPFGSVSPPDVARSCRDFARRILRTADPTYSGLLDIVTSPGNVTTCAAAVRGSARLVGSLVGQGDNPLHLIT